MRQVFFKWITLDAQNYIPEVWYAALVLWIGLLVFGVFSIRSLTVTPQVKLVWTLVILLVPLAGLFAYCCYCLGKVDYYMLDSWILRKGKDSRA